MKGKDLAFLAGGALLVYLLMPKKLAEAAPGVSVISMPTPGAAPLDIGGLFEGIASIFGAMPAQVVPEINIPEFKWPDINIPEFGWPEVPEFIIPDIFPKGNGEEKSLLETITDPWTKGYGQWKSDVGFVSQEAADVVRKATTLPSLFVPSYILKREAKEWEEKGYPEYITPEWWYARREATTGLLPEQLLAIREAGRGVSSESYTIDEEDLPYKLQEVPGR